MSISGYGQIVQSAVTSEASAQIVQNEHTTLYIQLREGYSFFFFSVCSSRHCGKYRRLRRVRIEHLGGHDLPGNAFTALSVNLTVILDTPHSITISNNVLHYLASWYASKHRQFMPRKGRRPDRCVRSHRSFRDASRNVSNSSSGSYHPDNLGTAGTGAHLYLRSDIRSPDFLALLSEIYL